MLQFKLNNKDIPLKLFIKYSGIILDKRLKQSYHTKENRIRLKKIRLHLVFTPTYLEIRH